MIRLAFAFSLAVWAFAASTALAQTPEEIGERAEQLKVRAVESVATLVPLLKTRAAMASEVEVLESRFETAGEADKEAAGAELQAMRDELAEIDDQISVLATGISESEFQRRDAVTFDLKSELESLVQPFIVMLQSATEEARQIEAARRALDEAHSDLAAAQGAIETLEAVRAAASNETLLSDLDERAEEWARREEKATNQIAAFNQQLDDLLNNRAGAGSQVQSAAKGFFRERGLSLLFGVLSFAATLTLLRVVGQLAGRTAQMRGLQRSFQTRLAGLLFKVFTLAASFAAMIIVFNLRNDWLLLSLAGVMVLALAWIGIRMLPGLIEQVTVLLNLGAVQENERVVFDGVPFMVKKLDLYTDLENPALDGGEFTLPVRELIGRHSRPAAESEAWFPSDRGDWVRLADGKAGQVIAQTPELVVIELLGGARVTYQTADYLAQTPENLSHGFRAEVAFGIGYAHQADATGAIMKIMSDRVRELMTAFIGAEHVVNVAVDFLQAGASSLDYEIEVDVRGSAAARFDDIERELARVAVQVATEQGWEIPFQQIVLHQATPTA